MNLPPVLKYDHRIDCTWFGISTQHGNVICKILCFISSNSSKKKSYEEIDLNDSDDESLDNKPFRSRLKPSKATKKKETKDVKPNEDIKTITIEDSESNDDDVAALKPSAVAATKRPIVEIESDSSGKVSESIETNTKRAKMSETTEPDAGLVNIMSHAFLG